MNNKLINNSTKLKNDINDGVLEFSIIGTGFMYNMVRIIIALMLKVGEGKLQPSDIERIIEGKEMHIICLRGSKVLSET